MANGIQMMLVAAGLALAGCATAPTAPQTAQTETTGFQKCAETFESVYAEHRKHPKADTLLWNAADCHAAAGNRTQAILTYDLLLARFPQSEHVDGARAALHRLETPTVGDP